MRSADGENPTDALPDPAPTDTEQHQNNTFHDHDSSDSDGKSERFVETFFEDGPLGITLRRRQEDGIVFIFEVIADSQAVHLDVAVGDELWSVNSSDIGGTRLDKEAWNGLISYIKQSPRPLRLVWRRTIPKSKPVDNPNSSPSNVNVVSPPAIPVPQNSAEYLELQKVLARVIVKEKESNVLGIVSGNQPKRMAFPDPMSFLQEGRKVLRNGDLNTEQKSTSLWSKAPSKKRLILMNDLLFLAVPQSGNVFLLEAIIELTTCKIKSLGQLFGVNSSDQVTTDLSFELFWPGGQLQLFSETRESKDLWVMSIYKAICDVVSSGGAAQFLGWRHQYMLGTMHSAVITRNEELVKEIIGLWRADRLSFISIQSHDPDGYTPLHYACMLRLQSIIRILHEATADVTVIDRNSLTPLHWAAMQLDDYSLSLLCSHVLDVDLLDSKSRSPLVIACLEGRDISGNTDPLLLKRCISAILPHKPNLHWMDEFHRTLLHYLGASWQHEPIELLLENGCPDINTLESIFGMPPLHFAAKGNPIKLAIGEGMKIMKQSESSSDHDTNKPELVDKKAALETVRVFLKYGAKPNLKDLRGMTVLSILLDSETEKNWIREDLEATIALLLSYGARPDESTFNQIRTKYPDLNVSVLLDKWSNIPNIDCKRLNIGLNHFESELGAHQEISPQSSAKLDVKAGSYCTLCGFQFTMFKRQHHCRLCDTTCCDDCSRKRAVVDGNPVRVCDCCFNRAMTVQERMNQEAMLANLNTDRYAANSNGQMPSTDKERLFGGARGASVDQTKSATGLNTNSKMSGTMATLSETHERLLERGEKLQKLSDRSEELSNQANEFARLAKQLNEQQKSRWF